MTVKLDRPTRTETVTEPFLGGISTAEFPAYDLGNIIMVVPPGSGRARRVQIVKDFVLGKIST